MPSGVAGWYDAVSAHEFPGNWNKAFFFAREAAARAPHDEGDPAFWNLDIAATVLQEWATASRRASESWTDAATASSMSSCSSRPQTAAPADAVPGLLDIWAAAGPERFRAGLTVIG
ncbi:hypothetical protein ACIQM3_26645 [Streptomyces sp. NPDC091271]|uniref:hypothetical protein n=1 Tax=Streptomyces sp. NPDC091271 TaxID=3365980 RepID=UPI00382C96C7